MISQSSVAVATGCWNWDRRAARTTERSTISEGWGAQPLYLLSRAGERGGAKPPAPRHARGCFPASAPSCLAAVFNQLASLACSEPLFRCHRSTVPRGRASARGGFLPPVVGSGLGVLLRHPAWETQSQVPPRPARGAGRSLHPASSQFRTAMVCLLLAPEQLRAETSPNSSPAPNSRAAALCAMSRGCLVLVDGAKALLGRVSPCAWGFSPQNQ